MVRPGPGPGRLQGICIMKSEATRLCLVITFDNKDTTYSVL